MKRNQGFTLIELIIVIVILGILAVTAAPKFLNFSKDARESTLKGVKGSLEAAAGLVHGKALLQSKKGTVATPETLTDPAGVTVVESYPAATAANIRAIASLNEEEWDIVNGGSGHGSAADISVVISPKGSTVGTNAADACHVVYTQAAASAQPVITAYSAGCK